MLRLTFKFEKRIVYLLLLLQQRLDALDSLLLVPSDDLVRDPQYELFLEHQRFIRIRIRLSRIIAQETRKLTSLYFLYLSLVAELELERRDSRSIG